MKHRKMNDIYRFYTYQKIPQNQSLKYLITIPCVNREERNAIQIIDKTFENFEKQGIFQHYPHFTVDILLFESGSKSLSYLQFIKSFHEKYPGRIKIMLSKRNLDGPQNIYRMFSYIQQQAIHHYDFCIWMDDDILVCKNFLQNMDSWVRQHINFTIFGSLYSPYQSYPIQNPNMSSYCQESFVRSYHGSCCTIFKPLLAKYITPLWFKTEKLRFVKEPDLRFRESIMKFFPNIKKFLVCSPSIVQHLNIGSAIYQHKQIRKGHTARHFIGIEEDPLWYSQNELSIDK